MPVKCPIMQILLINTGFDDLMVCGCWSKILSIVKYGTNLIADIVTDGPSDRVAGPTMLCQLPYPICQLRSLIIIWSFWSDMLVNNKLAKFGGIIDMTQGDLIRIDLMKSSSPVLSPSSFSSEQKLKTPHKV